MAKVVVEKESVVIVSRWSRYSFLVAGAAIGALWWVITAILSRYAVDPLVCGPGSGCDQSLALAGNIGLVVVAVIGIFTLIRVATPRPLIIALATSILLWGFGSFIAELVWYEALGWSVLLFVASYLLFWLVARIRSLAAALITTIAVLIVVRVALILL